MIRSLFSAITGLGQSQQRMDIIGNNIANINTAGFKSSRVNFADSFSQTLRASSQASGTTAANSAIQIGSGVTTAGIATLYTQGAITRTGVQTDLAIAGDGYFVVRDTSNNEQMATRAGDFRVDSTGFLVTNTGQRVQGYSDAALTTIGDIKIDNAGMPVTADPNARIISYAFDSEGKLNVQLSDGTQFVRGQILLQKFTDPQGLMKAGNNLYSRIANAGPLDWAGTPGIPSKIGLGKLEAGALELSNVDMANEFTNLITTQRAYQASARIISTSDDMLQELVNLKR